MKRKLPEEVFESIKSAKKEHEALPTGFNKLDEKLDGGFFKKELIVLGAHTGVGKSAIAGVIFHHIANKGYKSAFFSLEISSEMVVSRMVGAMTNIKPTRVRYGFLDQQEYEAKLKAEGEIVGLSDLINLYDDVYELQEIIKEVKENNYDFVVVDFIQNVMDTTVRDEYTRLTKVSLALQQLAKEQNVCILALSQLSNQSAREGMKSKTVEYKGSGAIAMVCDLGFFLDRDINGEESDNQVLLKLRKNRRGVAGIEMVLQYQYPGGNLTEV